MKIRNSSSKAFHQIQHKSKKSFSQQLQKLNSNIGNNKCPSTSLYKQLITQCYNNLLNQEILCSSLSLPFIPGPISLNSIPQTFFHEDYLSQEDKQTNVINQLAYLFQYLKKVKEYFFCWVIYYHHQLKILTVKMIKKCQIQDNQDLLNTKYCIIGIFVGKQPNKTKTNNQSFNSIHDQNKFTSLSCAISNKIIKSKQLITNDKPIVDINKTGLKIKQRKSIKSFKILKPQPKTSSSSFQKQNEINQKSNSNLPQLKVNRNFKKKKQVQQLLNYTSNIECYKSKQKQCIKKQKQCIKTQKQVYPIIQVSKKKNLSRNYYSPSTPISPKISYESLNNKFLSSILIKGKKVYKNDSSKFIKRSMSTKIINKNEHLSQIGNNNFFHEQNLTDKQTL